MVFVQGAFMGAFFGVADLDAVEQKSLHPLASVAARYAALPGHTGTYHAKRIAVGWWDGGARGQSCGDRDDGSFGSVVGDPLLGDSPDTLLAALGFADLPALGRAEGQFAAWHWDDRAGVLSLCPDKLATRPVYLYRKGSRLVFATTMSDIRLLIGEELELDDSAVGEIIVFGQPLGIRTAYHNLQVLRPGELLRISADATERRRYHHWGAEAPLDVSYDDALDLMTERFLAALSRRLSGRGIEEAFLSGGMDSRAVVAGLVRLGVRVRTFGSSRPGSADDVLGVAAAEALGTEHVRYVRDFVQFNSNHAEMAARHFPRMLGDSGARAIWTGHGGSVGMGHVYLTAENVAYGAHQADERTVQKLFPALAKRLTRLLPEHDLDRLRRRALSGALEEMAAFDHAPPQRRTFLFYMLNDQMRHSYRHFETFAETGVHYIMPFFDGGVLDLVMRLPIEWFLRHRFYNDWLARLSPAAASVAWQPYPGHLPGPVPMPSTIGYQWAKGVGRSRANRRHRKDVMQRVLAWRWPNYSLPIRKRFLQTAELLGELGVNRFGYEITFAQRLYESINGPIPLRPEIRA